jgi:threonine/homoserine/homoserine lactone efflux protein
MMKALRSGLFTGLLVELAIGPVFLLIMNLTLQRTLWDGLAGTAAATIVDFFYIALAILGVRTVLENKRNRMLFGIISSLVLIIFGILILGGTPGEAATQTVSSMNLWSSFAAVFLVTLSSPMTIVFNSGVLTAKALERRYAGRELAAFGIGYGLSTLIAFSGVTLLFSLLRQTIPFIVIRILNIAVGSLLIAWGVLRLGKSAR